MSSKRSMSLELCNGCPGLCCKGIEENATRPRTKQEIADVRWQLHFENIQYFIRNRYWYQYILSPCMYLDENDFCTAYEKRPDVCRDHMPPDCEKFHPIYDTIFETPEDFDQWIAKEEQKRKRRRAKMAKK